MNSQQKKSNAQFFATQFSMIREGVWIWRDHPEHRVVISGNGKPRCSAACYNAIAEITPAGWVKKNLKVDKDITPYGFNPLTRATDAVDREIAKHKELIDSNYRTITEVMVGLTMARCAGMEDMIQKGESREGFCVSHIKHSELMISLFEAYKVGDIPSVRSAIRSVKSNAQDIENYMRECVDYGYYSENEYMEHMDRFYKELNAWERFL